MKEQFEARMLRIHFGESDQWRGKPLHEAILAKCQELGLAGAIVYRGIEGYGTSTRVRHASLWKLSRDAPIMVSIIDTEEQQEPVARTIDAMVVIVVGPYGFLSKPLFSTLWFSSSAAAARFCSTSQLPYHACASGAGVARRGAQRTATTGAGSFP